MADWQDVLDEFQGVARVRRTLFTCAGTWAFWDQGFQADVGRAVADSAGWRWQPVGYNTTFGPIGGAPDSLSYNESVAAGVAEAVRLINATPGEFALCGYSMGAETVGRVVLELQSGSLQHRLADCAAEVTFGDPTRQKYYVNPAGGKGWGISKLEIPQSAIAVRTYALPGDMYCTTPDGAAGDDMHAVYDMLTDLQLHSFGGLVTDFMSSVLLKLGLALLANPLGATPGVVEALVRLITFAATNAHAMYGPYVQDAVDFLNSI